MNKALALLALPALLLTGCSAAQTAATPQTSTASAASPSVSATPAAAAVAATKAPSREDQVKEIYLNAIYKSEPALRNTGVDNDLVDIGQGFCKMYDGGAMGSDINSFILKAGGVAYTVKQLVAVHGAAVGAYCPQHMDKMDK
ncbi:DUF732 domain-containing protein [Arthrobacter liuii]|uniref:DUF732 domain-containing protein n=1 Tax=Arthrobacter liuii TaxID=1476996 RepID=A0ABQ2AP66_9MICC|nr:DUF732 domain-containing protein [Arthrobacter liuii]GGH94701.1 hypothetical protein GCM10007170_18510 [Arthrobacter liuii]